MICSKFISGCLFLSLTCMIVPAKAQQTKRYDLAALLEKGQLKTNDSNQTKALENSIPDAISTKGIVWLKAVRFRLGTIDIDLRGKNVFLESFLGIAFHGKNDSVYDAVYFRPFNFRHADTLRRKWSVQYISSPHYLWDRLRKEHPLVYENAVVPVPDPDDWFHATIVIEDKWLTVYVNHSDKPSLHVHLLNDRRSGGLALWDDELSGDFANLTISH